MYPDLYKKGKKVPGAEFNAIVRIKDVMPASLSIEDYKTLLGLIFQNVNIELVEIIEIQKITKGE